MIVAAARGAIVVAMLAGALHVSVSPATAQGCGSESGRYVVRVQPGVLTFPSPTPDDFASGWIEHGPVEINVRPRGAAERPWVVCIRADSPDMGRGKPITDLQYRRSGEGVWTSITAGDQALAEGDRGDRISIDFRILLDETMDPAGSYRADYTVTAARS